MTRSLRRRARLEADFKGGKQQQGQVRLEIAADEAMHFEDGFRADFAAAALVGLGGIGEPVAEHHLARCQCRLDDFGDRLGPVGKHQGHLGQRGEAGGSGIEQQFADAVAGRGASGLARDYGRRAALLHPGGQPLELRGFS